MIKVLIEKEELHGRTGAFYCFLDSYLKCPDTGRDRLHLSGLVPFGQQKKEVMEKIVLEDLLRLRIYGMLS